MPAYAAGQLYPTNREMRIIRNTYLQFDRDRIPLVAAGTTFFVLLAIFPAFASVVSLYGLFADRAKIAQELALVSPFLPHNAVVVLNVELQRLLALGQQRLGLAFLVTTVVALWSASGGLRALVEGLNVAYDLSEGRGFLRLSMIAAGLTALAIVLCVLALNLAVVIPLFLHRLPFAGSFQQLFAVISWPATFCFSLFSISAVYSFAPCWRRACWSWFSWGSLVAATLWLLGTLAFKWYVHQFGNFDHVYGNLGTLVGFLIWIWLSLLIVLFGAELNREIERERERQQE